MRVSWGQCLIMELMIWGDRDILMALHACSEGYLLVACAKRLHEIVALRKDFLGI